MSTQGFQKAVKGKKPLRLILGGPSSSGKSYTALEFAKFLSTKTGKRTAALDTEHGRLSLYADKYEFDVLEVEPPFHPNRMIELIHLAEDAGYGQFIIDSSTHFYNGLGGLLEIVNDAAKLRFGGNQYAGWSVGTPIQNAMIDTIIRSPMHIIFTIRAKQEHVETEKNGRKFYEKTGMEFVQRNDTEFDFDVAIMMDMDNNGIVTKGLIGMPPGTYFKHPGKETIEAIMNAIEKDSTDVSQEKKPIYKSPAEVVAEQKAAITELVKSLGGSKNESLVKLFTTMNIPLSPKGIKELSDIESVKNLFAEMEKLEMENK
jgi:hypothetical protein